MGSFRRQPRVSARGAAARRSVYTVFDKQPVMNYLECGEEELPGAELQEAHARVRHRRLQEKDELLVGGACVRARVMCALCVQICARVAGGGGGKPAQTAAAEGGYRPASCGQ